MKAVTRERVVAGIKPICVAALGAVVVGMFVQWALVGWGLIVFLTLICVLCAFIVGFSWKS